ncbi:SubName: Full=Uncharacterized protein {ECO:0000313/EMBL:CCA69753.1} [Serendipita indica DSM 11827]|nr:SubName: Full=Uncharacterized protein {ECO:0000313/EMBL:CCA69753.1} [Serendipita indica DSM 11827]
MSTPPFSIRAVITAVLRTSWWNYDQQWSMVYAARGKWAEVTAVYEEIVEHQLVSCPDNPETVQYMLILSVIYMALGKEAQGLELLSQVSEISK